MLTYEYQQPNVHVRHDAQPQPQLAGAQDQAELLLRAPRCRPPQPHAPAAAEPRMRGRVRAREILPLKTKTDIFKVLYLIPF